MSRAHAVGDGDHGVRGLHRGALRPARQGVPAAELLGLPGAQRLQRVRGQHVRDAVEQLAEVPGQVGVPGVRVHQVAALERRRPSGGRRRRCAARRWRRPNAAGARWRTTPSSPLPSPQQCTSTSSRARSSRARNSTWTPAPAVHVRRVLPGQQPDLHRVLPPSTIVLLAFPGSGRSYHDGRLGFRPALAPGPTGPGTTARRGCGGRDPVGDQVELLPGADARTVGDQGGRARVLGGDVVAVGLGQQADGAVGVVDELEGLPGADGGAVGDQRGRARVVRGDDQVVGVGAQRDDGAAAGVEQTVEPPAGPARSPPFRSAAPARRAEGPAARRPRPDARLRLRTRSRDVCAGQERSTGGAVGAGGQRTGGSCRKR